MNSLIQLKHTTPVFFVALTLTCLWLGPASKAIGAAPAESVNVIYSFTGNEDGEYADTDLETDGAGNIYGTTVLGGDFGSGKVFKLTHTSTAWVQHVLYSVHK